MIVGALVLPEVTDGITEASATRRPGTPRTRRSGVVTAIESMPILQVPTWWWYVIRLRRPYSVSSSSVRTSGPGAISRARQSLSARAWPISRESLRLASSAATSAGSDRYRGSSTGFSAGSADRSVSRPRLSGRMMPATIA
jgi:hypothetical protein